MSVVEGQRLAERVDAATGVREIAGFHGRGSTTFGVTYLPSESTGAGVVICPSVYADVIPLYRREVLLARALASRGLAVQRFQYRGSGHSPAADGGMSFESLVEDATAAARHLESVSGVSVTSFVGARFGALVAAAALREVGGSALALWQPVMKGSVFFREALRAHLAKEAAAGAPAVTTTQRLDDLRERGSIDVMGYELTRSLYDSSTERELGTLAQPPRSALLVQLGGEEMRPDFHALAESWRQAGASVTEEVVTSREVWWFLDERAIPAEALVASTCDWVGRTAGLRAARR